MSEVDKTRDIVLPYVQGNGVDLGSGGFPVVPWAIQIDLHRHHKPPSLPVQYVDTATRLPFKNRTLDWVYASHILEDFREWDALLIEWIRVLKPGGYLIIQLPDHDRYRAAVAAGQEDNLSHKHEADGPHEVWNALNALLPNSFQLLHARYYPVDDYNILTVVKFTPRHDA